MDDNEAVDLLRTVGVYRLGGTDGCPCTNFSVRGVNIDISCRKSDAAMLQIAPDFFGIKLRVHSRHLDASHARLRLVAEEVIRQIANEGYAIMVRYCAFEDDKDLTCVYCGKPRDEPSGYLCKLHLSDPAIADQFSTKHDITTTTPAD